eukprot:m51a1_g3452 hypothetical protein (85) ;mRNA; r:681477-681781
MSGANAPQKQPGVVTVPANLSSEQQLEILKKEEGALLKLEHSVRLTLFKLQVENKTLKELYDGPHNAVHVVESDDAPKDQAPQQ